MNDQITNEKRNLLEALRRGALSQERYDAVISRLEKLEAKGE